MERLSGTVVIDCGPWGHPTRVQMPLFRGLCAVASPTLRASIHLRDGNNVSTIHM